MTIHTINIRITTAIIVSMNTITIVSVKIICMESLFCTMSMSVFVEASSSSLCSVVPVVCVGRFVEIVVTEDIDSEVAGLFVVVGVGVVVVVDRFADEVLVMSVWFADEVLVVSVWFVDEVLVVSVLLSITAVLVMTSIFIS